MLTLWTSHAKFHNFDRSVSPILRLSTDQNRPKPLRERELYLGDPTLMPEGFTGAVVVGESPVSGEAPTLNLPEEFSYLGDGDIIRIEPEHGRIRVIFRENSNQNSFLLTERCNHYCLMCSQPPRNVDDGWIVDETLEVIRMLPQSTREIGFTGGEPTLLGDRFIELVAAMKCYLPETTLHVLTNGRTFASSEFCKQITKIGHHDLMFGIPVYADVSTIHDYIVQADGAFDETIRGIVNLKRFGQKVELRVVLHKQSLPRLQGLAEFIVRNLMFVDHIALMGLEVTGFTKANMPDLWIDPYNYMPELADAALYLEAAGMNISIYNLQHCLLDKRVWHFSRHSISDWKNEYLDVCKDCNLLTDCGGLFSTGMSKISDHIRPF